MPITCSGCGFENPTGIRFCGQCAQPLTTDSPCPSCGFLNPAGFRFCGECATPLATPAEPEAVERTPRDYTPKHLAEKILQSRSALEGERKQVTVLFADVKGSMDLAEGMDPEEWHRILNRFFEILTEGVHHFEGTVNQYTGDGIMALFGAPIAHEDHAQRACYAALRINDELRRYADELRRSRGLSFSVRMGLNSGEVVVGKIGDDLRMDYTAQGHTVGVARRIQEVAAPDRIHLGESTRQLVAGYLQLRELGSFELKGVRNAVPVYELLGVGPLRTRLDVSRERGFSRFVGRADEMRDLEAALARAEQGFPQIVGLVGEAGVGKSRLSFEFLERCRARGLMTYETHGVSHGKAIPFLPIRRFFRAFFGIAEQDSDATAREKIAGRLLLLDEGFRETLPAVFDFLAVTDPAKSAPPMEPEARQRQLLAVVKGVAQARAGRETTVALLEDLHWFDAGSEAFLEPLLELPPGATTLMVVNFRPEYRAGWMNRSWYRHLPLLPLGQDEIRELLGDLLGGDASLEGLAELVRERTGGNPFFIEEVVQSLAESGALEGVKGAYRLVQSVETLAVPDRVQSVLAARIDRLPEREKQLLQTASVIGKRFAEPILREVAVLAEADLKPALAALQEGEFVYQEVLYPVAEYAFKHPLTQEVALHSQLRERRARIHAAVARALEASSGEKLDEQAALLAHHWEEAGEPLAASRWHRRAAGFAGLSHPEQLIRHWRRVRELLASEPESPESVQLRTEALGQTLVMGIRTGTLTDDTEALISEGQALIEKSGDPVARIHFLRGYGGYLSFDGRPREAKQTLEEAVRIADELGEPGLRIGVLGALNIVHFSTGPYSEAIATNEAILEMAQTHPEAGRGFLGYDPRTAFTAFRGAFLAELGRFEEATREVERAIEFGRQGDDPGALSIAYEFAGRVAGLRGDLVLAVAHGRRGVEMAEEIGTPNMIGLAHAFLGQNFVLQGEYEAAVVELEIASERGLRGQRSIFLPILAQAWLGRGDAARSLAVAEEALSVARERGTASFGINARVAIAHAWLATEGKDAIGRVESVLEEAAQIAERIDAVARLPEIHTARAELARVREDTAAQERELREAIRLFRSMGAPGRADRLETDLAS